MKLVVDAYSWVDYFLGNEAGEKVKQYIENSSNDIIINILNLAEISSFFERNKLSKEEIDESFKILFSLSKIYNFNAEFSRDAGALHAEMKKKIDNFGLIDAFVLLTARKLNAKILTGDEHFKNFKEAILIKN